MILFFRNVSPALPIHTPVWFIFDRYLLVFPKYLLAGWFISFLRVYWNGTNDFGPLVRLKAPKEDKEDFAGLHRHLQRNGTFVVRFHNLSETPSLTTLI
jgi:hypothetical protein